MPRGSEGDSGKPSKMGTSAELFCNSLLGLLTKGAVRIRGMLVGSGGQITSSTFQTHRPHTVRHQVKLITFKFIRISV